MNLTHRQFEILIAAAESETFSAAAQRLGITQPSLSKSIRRLERETGTCLFERTTRFIRLTDEGRYATAVARDAVRDFQRALDRLASRHNDRQGRITLAALPSVACAVLPAALGRFRRRFPDVAVAVHDVQHERALALLTEGRADVAVTIEPAGRDDLAFEEVAADTAHLVCRNDHPLLEQTRVRWRDLAKYPFIGITRISSVRRLTDAAFVHAELALEPRYEVEQIPSAVALVEAGLGVTALPSLTFAMFKGRRLATRPLSEPRLRRNIGIVAGRDRDLPSHADALLALVRRSLAQRLR